MEKVLSFFRVFDLAFFAPGAVLLWGLHSTGWLGDVDPLKTNAAVTTVEGLTAILLTIGFIYVLGLLAHGVQSLLNPLPRARSRVQGTELSWFQHLKDETRADLAMYFWYMRATCWNLCVAAIAVAALLAVKSCWYAVVPAAAVFLLGWLGNEYDEALKRAAGSSAARARLYAAQPPKGGEFRAGAIVWNTAPGVGKPLGWVFDEKDEWRAFEVLG